VLELRRVSKRFVGVVATDDVTLEVRNRRGHALIGPNGAGQTTLISQISGSLPSDRGESASTARHHATPVPMNGEGSGLRAATRSRASSSASPCSTTLLSPMQARSGSSFSFWRPRRCGRQSIRRSPLRRRRNRLSQKLSSIAATLAHGEQRALEVGLALATRPKAGAARRAASPAWGPRRRSA